MLVLLFVVVSVGQAANILVTAPFRGKHLSSINNIASFLAEEGHNVTLLSAGDDPDILIHPNVSFILPKTGGTGNFDAVTACIETVAAGLSTEKAVTQVFIQCLEHWRVTYKACADYFMSGEVKRIIKDTNFDIIIAEEFTMKPVIMVVKKLNIPVAAYFPDTFYDFPRIQQNLPMLLTSEPSLLHTLRNGQSPSFTERFLSLIKLAGFLSFINTIELPLRDNYEKYWIKSDADIMEHISLFLVHDHAALSFPHLLPSNVVMTGGFDMKPAEPLLAGPLLDFILSSNKNVILFSFSYGDPYLYESWFAGFIKTVCNLNYRVILSIKTKSSVPLPDFSNDIYVTDWVPQQDLLGSGTVQLFITHCSNSGRIESIYHNVPLLCVPIIADQLTNSVNVEQKGFGEILLKEEITENSVREKVDHTTANAEFYRANMRDAMAMFHNDPAKGKDKIRFYINLLIKHGNLDFLQNKVIKQQTFVEIYNVDIALCLGALAVLILLFGARVTLWVVMFALVRRKEKNN